MKALEFRDGILVGFEDFLKSAAQMDTKTLEKLTENLHRIIARKKRPNRSERELVLIKIAYSKLPSKIKEEYDLLYKKLQEETISEIEHTRLLALVEISETHQVKWLTALTELAEIRKVSLQEIKEELGLDKEKFCTNGIGIRDFGVKKFE